ncbi:energy-coupling factor transporter transmembrane protein EcfT [Thermosulfurimonas marina]|uniref:Energy-coupling factor transporter transmembrane protein EcfT n=1 Tax=Thermosulfurimonas marina TaxID=2047767 RepID=A0A6H1WTU7_9BACT|nr:energy-coupling factor transporter transmembrane protein EcfT [Thermosulfurimonas marina]QJA06633.1 energy-coupling factor transporter transmembrane protein EcfT [Thermosulfurimonas marina]
MHLPEIDRYGRGTSPLHRLDPRLKLAALFSFLLATALARNPSAAGLSLALALGLVILSRLPASFVWWHLRAPLALGLLLALVLSLTAPQGLFLSFTILLRIGASFLFFLALVGTSPLPETLRAAAALKAPEKLLALFVMSYRYAYTLLDDLRHLQLAMVARGFRERSNLATYRLKARLYALLLLRAHEETERTLRAMYARGFHHLRHGRPAPLQTRKVLAGLPLLAAAGLLLFLNILW